LEVGLPSLSSPRRKRGGALHSRISRLRGMSQPACLAFIPQEALSRTPIRLSLVR
jgi:hypothetical protein